MEDNSTPTIKMEWPEWANHPVESKEYQEGLKAALNSFWVAQKERIRKANDKILECLLNKRYGKAD